MKTYFIAQGARFNVGYNFEENFRLNVRFSRRKQTSFTQNHSYTYHKFRAYAFSA